MTFVCAQEILVHNPDALVCGGGFSSQMSPAEAPRYNKYWNNNSPKQTTPGTTRMDWVKENGKTGALENSRVVYDKYGRQTHRVDYTDHMMPKDHSKPHLHTTEYGPLNRDGKSRLFNFW